VRRAAARLQTTIVGNARRAGTNWSAIGRSAGLTKQAAWTRWKDVESAGTTLAGLEAHLVVVVTIGMRHVDDDNPEHGLDLAAYSWGWVDAVARDSHIEPLLKEGVEKYGGSPLVHSAMTQFALVLDTLHQMEEIQDLFHTAGIREILDTAPAAGQHALGFSVSSADGDFYVSLVGNMVGVDLDAELRALTQVLTGAGYEVAADPDDDIVCSIIARLAPAAWPRGGRPVGISRFPDRQFRGP
jgi:hypothetical protein